MVHSTILKLRKEKAELIETNQGLLTNLESQRNENAALQGQAAALLSSLEAQRNENAVLRGQMGMLQKEKDECKSKCEVALHQKDMKIQELEEYKKSLRTTFEHLRDGDWSYSVKQEPDGKIAITHWVLPGARAKKS